jgi:hypothetical protein
MSLDEGVKTSNKIDLSNVQKFKDLRNENNPD